MLHSPEKKKEYVQVLFPAIRDTSRHLSASRPRVQARLVSNRFNSRTYLFICPSALPRSVCGSIYLFRISIHFAHQSIYRVWTANVAARERQWRVFFLSRITVTEIQPRRIARNRYHTRPAKEINYRPRQRRGSLAAFPLSPECRNTF